MRYFNYLKIYFLVFTMFAVINAQFLDSFDKDKIEGWFFFTGDGNASMDFTLEDGFARMNIDATKDKYNVYWTLIKRNISEYIDVGKLSQPGYELRVEAKVRVSDAPRRLNFMLNTQRTTDFHEHLKEYDIADTENWHIISMTTKNFDAVPGDSVFVQLCATDFGPGKYHVDIDYYKADVVDISNVKPDKGEPLPYHPPVPPVSSFSNRLPVSDDCIINSVFPDINFNDWYISADSKETKVLTVNSNQWALLKWDFAEHKNLNADGPGLLELTTCSVADGGNFIEVLGEDLGMEFGKVRVIEIFGGDLNWEEETVTYDNFIGDKTYDKVFNPQMTFDTDLNQEKNGKTYITISRPVMQRLLDGKTKGLLLRPLGAINASVFAGETDSGPALYFNTGK